MAMSVVQATLPMSPLRVRAWEIGAQGCRGHWSPLSRTEPPSLLPSPGLEVYPSRTQLPGLLPQPVLAGVLGGVLFLGAAVLVSLLAACLMNRRRAARRRRKRLRRGEPEAPPCSSLGHQWRVTSCEATPATWAPSPWVATPLGVLFQEAATPPSGLSTYRHRPSLYLGLVHPATCCPIPCCSCGLGQLSSVACCCLCHLSRPDRSTANLLPARKVSSTVSSPLPPHFSLLHCRVPSASHRTWGGIRESGEEDSPVILGPSSPPPQGPCLACSP